MGVVASAKLFAAGATWRLAGLSGAGRSLIDAMSHGDDSDRTLAGMLLVKAGDRSVPLVSEAITSGAPSLELVDVLASIGTNEARSALERVAGGGAPAEVSAAAQGALDTLDEIDRHHQ